MEKIQLGSYEILLTGKPDGSTHDTGHWVHQEFFSIEQVHGDNLYVLDEQIIGSYKEYQADAIISASGAVGTYTADCVPIALLGKTYFAVVHGSWRTLQASILQKTVKYLCRQGEDVVDIDVYIGPCIKKEVYEVGREFYDLFPAIVLHQQDGLLTLDMVQYTRHVLIMQGCVSHHIQVHPDCTYQQNNKWFSYRKGEKGLRNFMGVRCLYK